MFVFIYVLGDETMKTAQRFFEGWPDFRAGGLRELHVQNSLHIIVNACLNQLILIIAQYF